MAGFKEYGERSRQSALVDAQIEKTKAEFNRITKAQKAYEGTVLDTWNPDTIVQKVDWFIWSGNTPLGGERGFCPTF